MGVFIILLWGIFILKLHSIWAYSPYCYGVNLSLNYIIYGRIHPIVMGDVFPQTLLYMDVFTKLLQGDIFPQNTLYMGVFIILVWECFSSNFLIHGRIYHIIMGDVSPQTFLYMGVFIILLWGMFLLKLSYTWAQLTYCYGGMFLLQVY